jgi:hypothetical protein
MTAGVGATGGDATTAVVAVMTKRTTRTPLVALSPAANGGCDGASRRSGPLTTAATAVARVRNGRGAATIVAASRTAIRGGAATAR